MRSHIMDGTSWAPPRRGGRAGQPSFARLRHALRQVGAALIVSLGFLVELGWSFVGSVGLGLRPGGSGGPFQAAAWVAGIVLVAATTAAAALLALPDKSGMD